MDYDEGFNGPPTQLYRLATKANKINDRPRRAAAWSSAFDDLQDLSNPGKEHLAFNAMLKRLNRVSVTAAVTDNAALLAGTLRGR
jgi:hypothetical protein